MEKVAPPGKHCQISCKVKYIRLSEEESKECEGPDICHRDPRTDDVAEDQIKRADQKCDDADFTDTAGFISDKEFP